MGCVPEDRSCEPNEYPRHRVTLTRAFWLARTETTVGEFRRFAKATGYRTAAERENRGRFWHFDKDEWDWTPGLSWRAPFDAAEPALDSWPAVQIAWNDADTYCRWSGGRLPTEAEWERVARGGQERQIHVWGNQPLPRVAGVNHANGPDETTGREFRTFEHFVGYDDGYARIAPVGSFAPNRYGLHDMAGNVYEWTADWIEDAPYARKEAVDPAGRVTGEIKAVRGAGWGYPPSQFRISYRAIAGTDFWTATFGFRCARDAPPPRSNQ
jgi:formylglycine-generating enzyme